jgi:hypothetical protein
MKDEAYYVELLKELFPIDKDGKRHCVAKYPSERPILTLDSGGGGETYPYSLMFNKSTAEYGKFYGRYLTAKQVVEVHDTTLADLGMEISPRPDSYPTAP